ncbi:NUDIX domain-containing protein [Paenibacillus sp. FSL P4-0184]|uniref:NUDIX domain-containing protein n=1 Tax=Paenibacillus sp. FSL P4-0184 TaxID=2921632 RepID=UPI0030F558C5
MKIVKPIRKKVYGFILQDNEVGEKTLLVYLNEPEVPFRLVGGNVDAGETEEEALFREIQEESGLKQFKLVKKIGQDCLKSGDSLERVKERTVGLFLTNYQWIK